MAAPWLPSTPSESPDYETKYRYYAPRQWPQGLFERESQADLDHQTIGRILGYVRQACWFVLERWWPWRDVG